MPLTRGEVVSAALDLLDEEGLDRLTMRRVATRLEVRHGALYWHFADKQALLDAMAERILDGVADIDPSLPPVDRLAELAQRTRRALIARRDGARVVAGTFVTEPSTLAAGEVGVTAALDAGAPLDEAVLLAFAIQEYVLGHTIEEQSRDQLAAAGTAVADERTIDPGRYPNLRGSLERQPAAARGEAGFAYGLELMLAGVRSRWPAA